ncbi:hypothetical protein Tco_0709296 [Tanacetum coccineum]
MSSDNASSAVTYTSISSDSNGPSSWGIPLENAGEIPEMDPYEEVAQQGQAHPLSPAYVPDPMELDEHVPVYVPEPEHPEYQAPSDDDIQVEDQPYAEDASPTAESPGYIADSDSMEDDTDADSIDYPDEPEDGEEDDDEDPEEDPSEEHDPEDDDEDPEEDPNEEDEPSENSDETEPVEEDETAATPPPPRHHGARISVRPQTPMAASTQALIDAFAAGSPTFPLPPPINPTYDQAPLGHRAAMIPESFAAAVARASRGQYDFVDVVGTGQGLVRSPSHDSRTIARAADRVEDVVYVRALQAFERRMMPSIEEVNLRVSYQVQARKRESEDFYTQRTAYETELQEVRQAYLRSEAQNRALLVRLETLETHITRIAWQRQSAEDRTVRHMMRTHVLEARAQIDTVEDTGSSC